MQMNEEQYQAFTRFLLAMIMTEKLDADSADHIERLRAERKFRNTVGLHQHSDQSGPWKVEE